IGAENPADRHAPELACAKHGGQVEGDHDALRADRSQGLEHARDDLVVAEMHQARTLDLDEQRDLRTSLEQVQNVGEQRNACATEALAEALRLARCSNTVPRSPVVRSSRWSWITTGIPSADRWTSSSRKRSPSPRAEAKAG